MCNKFQYYNGIHGIYSSDVMKLSSMEEMYALPFLARIRTPVYVRKFVLEKCKLSYSKQTSFLGGEGAGVFLVSDRPLAKKHQ